MLPIWLDQAFLLPTRLLGKPERWLCYAIEILLDWVCSVYKLYSTQPEPVKVCRETKHFPDWLFRKCS